jgi:hypothetical protein
VGGKTLVTFSTCHWLLLFSEIKNGCFLEQGVFLFVAEDTVEDTGVFLELLANRFFKYD